MTPQITATRVYKPPLAIDTHRAAEAAADLECRLDVVLRAKRGSWPA
jgi:hypothetical protein